MGSFDTYMAQAVVQAFAEGMSDPVTISGTEYQAIVQMDEVGTEKGARGGRRTVLRGIVTMKLSDWTASGAAEGSRIELPDGPARIVADPTMSESVAQFRVEGVGV